MSLFEKMTAINDQIRSLLGISDKMGLDAMASNLQTANDEVDAQSELIDQIQTILENKF